MHSGAAQKGEQGRRLMAQVVGQPLIVRAAKMPIQHAIQLGLQPPGGSHAGSGYEITRGSGEHTAELPSPPRPASSGLVGPVCLGGGRKTPPPAVHPGAPPPRWVPRWVVRKKKKK